MIYDLTIKNTDNKRGHKEILSLYTKLTFTAVFMDLWEGSMSQSLSRVINVPVQIFQCVPSVQLHCTVAPNCALCGM